MSSLPASHLIISSTDVCLPLHWVLPLLPASSDIGYTAPAIVGDGDGWLVFPLYIWVRYIMGESFSSSGLIDSRPPAISKPSSLCLHWSSNLLIRIYLLYPKMIYHMVVHHMVVPITPILWPLLISGIILDI